MYQLFYFCITKPDVAIRPPTVPNGTDQRKVTHATNDPNSSTDPTRARNEHRKRSPDRIDRLQQSIRRAIQHTVDTTNDELATDEPNGDIQSADDRFVTLDDDRTRANRSRGLPGRERNGRSWKVGQWHPRRHRVRHPSERCPAGNQRLVRWPRREDAAGSLLPARDGWDGAARRCPAKPRSVQFSLSPSAIGGVEYRHPYPEFEPDDGAYLPRLTAAN